MSIRLNKYIADCTGISRRAADALIAEGKVKVNRKIAEVGQSVDEQKDFVIIDGKRLQLQRKLYIAFNKPPGYLTTRKDPEGRKTIYDILPEAYKDLDPVGRLDRESSGLLILSNDGDFVHRLSHPRYEHRKVYRVTVDKVLTPKILEQIEAGVMLEPEGKLAIAQVTEIVDTKTIVLSLKTGFNRQIRRTLEALGYGVAKLKRSSVAGITLGSLKPGDSRPLKPSELKALLPRPQAPNKGKKQPQNKDRRVKDGAEDKRQEKRPQQRQGKPRPSR